MKISITYRHILTSLALLVLTTAVSIAQNAKKIPVYIKSDLVLEAGVYEVEGTHYVTSDVTLTVSEGVTLLFDKNATIRVDGGLTIIGSQNNLVNITSKDKLNPGNGFVINGVASDKEVTIDYVRFNHVKKPISFEFRWTRRAVSITSSVFKNSNYEAAAIQVREIDNLLTPQKITFVFKDNTFCNNTSSVLISNITSDLLTTEFDNNVLTRNEYTGRMRNGIFTSPVYMTYNTYQRNDIPTLTDNSVFDNFYSLYFEDTFNVGRTNISVIGNADELDLSGNYFGKPDKREIQETFDFISANYQAPFLYTNSTYPKPPNYLNGHFYEIYINGEEIREEIIFSAYNKTIDDIELRFNRPVEDGSNYNVYYHFLDENEEVKTVAIKNNLKWSEGNQFVKINLNEKLNKYGLKGYLEIDGFYDSDGMDVPTLYIGKKGLIEPEFRNYIPSNISPIIPNLKDLKISKDDTLVVMNPSKDRIVEKSRASDSIVIMKEGYWDLGVFSGSSIYFGDVNRTAISADPTKMTIAGGLVGGYQFNKRLGLKLSNNYMIIRGSDRPQTATDRNNRGTNFERNLSFRTTIIDAGVMLDYNLWKYNILSTYIPSVFAGVNAYYFKPMAQINNDNVQPQDPNQWYDLRSIGTGGQTLPGGSGEYEKIMFGIPMGMSIKRHLTQKLVVSASYTYTKIFTDYLDDVSTDTYPDAAAISSVNPQLDPGYAAALSNPGNQPTRFQRSLSDDNDGYGYWGLTFRWKLYQ